MPGNSPGNPIPPTAKVGDLIPFPDLPDQDVFIASVLVGVDHGNSLIGWFGLSIVPHGRPLLPNGWNDSRIPVTVVTGGNGLGNGIGGPGT